MPRVVHILLVFPIVATACGALNSAARPIATPIPITTAIAPPTSTIPLPPPTPTPRVVRYIVQEGDTLLSIAERYGTTVQTIIAANPNLENPDWIQIGQELLIPIEETETGP
nr:LysM domain-containing protein [Ardenticatena sp.]